MQELRLALNSKEGKHKHCTATILVLVKDTDLRLTVSRVTTTTKLMAKELVILKEIKTHQN